MHFYMYLLILPFKFFQDVIKMMVSRAHIFYETNIKWGIYVPSGCTKDDISEIVNYSEYNLLQYL